MRLRPGVAELRFGSLSDPVLSFPPPSCSSLPAPLQVPVMLRSNFCSLNDHSDKELTEVGEDPYDQV